MRVLPPVALLFTAARSSCNRKKEYVLGFGSLVFFFLLPNTEISDESKAKFISYLPCSGLASKLALPLNVNSKGPKKLFKAMVPAIKNSPRVTIYMVINVWINYKNAKIGH